MSKSGPGNPGNDGGYSPKECPYCGEEVENTHLPQHLPCDGVE